MEGKWILKGIDDLKVRHSKKDAVPERCRIYDIDNTENIKRIEKYRNMYYSLEPYRTQRKRCYNFYNGHHWEDKVVDPDDCNGKTITERELLMREGKQPLSNNLILKDVNFVLGLFRDGHKKPMAVATNVDNQEASDMMSNAMYYVYNDNEGLNIDADGLQELLVGGIAVSSTRPKWDKEKKRTSVEIVNENPAMMFFDGDLTDIRMNGLTTLGFIRSYSKKGLLQNFAKSKDEKRWLLDLYKSHSQDTSSLYGDPFDKDKYDNETFDIPYRRDQFRVIEAWELEEREMIRFHDKLEGKIYTTEFENKDKIDELNTARAKQLIEQGIENVEEMLLEPEYFIDTFWVVRYLTPYGHELYSSRTPYVHNQHPYTIRCYRMVNGTVKSWVSNLIPQQKYINRYISMMDFQQGAAAKGVLMFPEASKPKNMTHEQIIKTWGKSNGVIFTDMKPGAPMPQQFNTTAINNGEIQMLQIQQNLLEEISGVRGAATGQTASQGTPSSLYAQESQNAIVNLRDVTDFFVSYLRARNLKMMQVIMQYITDKFPMITVGTEFDKSAMEYDPDKIRNILFDIVPTESSINVPAYTMYQNDILKELAISGVIPAKMWLKRSGFPYQASLMKDLDEYEAQQQQMAMAQQQPMQQKAPTSDVDMGNPNGEQIGGAIEANSGKRPSELVAQSIENRMGNNNM